MPRDNMLLEQEETQSQVSSIGFSTSSSKYRKNPRDPENITSGLEVSFKDVFAEPLGPQDPEIVWRCKKLLYEYVFQFCYLIPSIIVAPIIVIVSAICFALQTFLHIWCWMPCFKHFKLSCFQIEKETRVILKSCCIPCCEAYGSCYSKIKVQYHKIDDIEPV